MTLEVIMSAYLSKLLPPSPDGQPQMRSRFLEFDDPVTPEAILDQLGMPLDEISVVTCNGQRIEFDKPMTSDGVIRFFPSLIGG